MSPQRELRVSVVGSSTAFMTVPHRTSRHDGPYPEHLDGELSSHGLSSRTISHTRWHGMINEARRDLETYRSGLPDVVVINYGMAECQPRVIPTWMYRNLVTWRTGTRRHEVFYRRKLVPLKWKLVRGWQRIALKVIGTHGHRLSPRRFTLELTRTINAITVDLAPLILVLDIDPVTEKVEHFVPGLSARVEHYNRLIKEAVANIANPDVRFVETSVIVRGGLGFEAALPDGFHRSSQGHREVAAMLAGEIAPWAKATLA